jgi:DNA polymerase III delta prime subunit
MNDLSRPYPTLGLAQRLWDDPVAVMDCADPGHLLYRYGLLSPPDEASPRIGWLQPIEMPALVSRALLGSGGPLPEGLSRLESEAARALNCEGRLLADRLAAQPPNGLQIVPMIGPRGTAFSAWASTLAVRTGRPVAQIADRYPLGRHNLRALTTFCWLCGLDLLLPEGWARDATSPVSGHEPPYPSGVPIRWYVPLCDPGAIRAIESLALTPPLRISGLSFDERVAAFHRGLPDLAADLHEAVDECARRFRFQEETIAAVTGTFSAVPLGDEQTLITACRNESVVDMDGLAQFVAPRFTIDDLVLAVAKMKQVREILTSMRHLTRVHYHWGTAAAWNESGVSVLFHGPPGTGKTMTAEVLSNELDLPMYRIDLSQVVNKYIGETEKNLKRIFDAAETSDCILFFDEADALFGKRTEVKDAHDRFANIEVSYLLERMERFKGLAILATNRRKDVDEAFMRRLRYVVEFPLPAVAERERIWRQSFPSRLDVSDVDFAFLAQRFQLSGGHIRSIVFNACLLSAGAQSSDSSDLSCQAAGSIPMNNVLLAVKRELEKMNRLANEEVFGPFSAMIREDLA